MTPACGENGLPGLQEGQVARLPTYSYAFAVGEPRG